MDGGALPGMTIRPKMGHLGSAYRKVIRILALSLRGAQSQMMGIGVDMGAIFVYQLALVYPFEHGLPLCVGLKAFLKSA